MNYQTITVQALTPTLGAEIHGVDLAKPLTPIQFKEIHDAFLKHQVIFFRDQELTLDQHDSITVMDVISVDNSCKIASVDAFRQF